MKIAIIIPAYNEERRIGNTIDAYHAFFAEQRSNGLEADLLVVLNGCRDNTRSIIEQRQKHMPSLSFIDLPTAGKGLAIKHGFLKALEKEYDQIGFVDADMATAPDQFLALIRRTGAHDGVIASRYMPGSTVTPRRPLMKEWGRRIIYHSLIRILFGLSLHDYQCGAKLFSANTLRTIAPLLTIHQWAFDVELLYLYKKHGFTIQEIPTIWHDQAFSTLTPFRSGMRMLAALVDLRIQHAKKREIKRTH